MPTPSDFEWIYIDDVNRYQWFDQHEGIIFSHKKPDGEWCEGAIMFVESKGNPVWELRSSDPLHLEPSIKCDCGYHGWIRNGQWEDAG